MSNFGISQNFRNASILGRFARTDQINEAVAKKSAASSSGESAPVKSTASVSSTSSDNIRASATKLTSVTSRYVTRSADHM
jgi:hypothetical protein